MALERAPIRAVIFDMDGVITDSEPLYAEAVNATIDSTPHRLSATDHMAIMGSSIEATWDYVIDRFGLDGGRERWESAYYRAVVRLLSQRADPTPGIYDLLQGLDQRHQKLGLATSSMKEWVDAVLHRLGLLQTFESIATSDMVAEAKPAPDLYLLAARGLKVPPDACLAIEDTPRGIEAAKRAGMRVVALRTKSTAHMDISAADRVLDSLSGFDYSWLQQN